MASVLQLCRLQPQKLHEALLRNHEQLMVASLLIGLTTGGMHWLSLRFPALAMQFRENIRAFPVEISFGVFALVSIGSLLAYTLYVHHRQGKDRRARSFIRQRYIDYILLCLAVGVSHAARRHLVSTGKKGLRLEQLERYRKEIETAVFRFRASSKKVFREPGTSYSLQALERYYRLDDDRYGDGILSLKRDNKSLLNVPALKRLLDF